MTCPACGTKAPSDARFCPTCGQVLSRRADERRVVTVLFGDLVAFTALSETLDPERVKNLVDDIFDRLGNDIISFGGRVDKVMGDGIVALFGAPVAHGDDAERAVRAALKMQATIASFQREVDVPIRMRIGVNTGEALVGSLRADTDYTATGDAVNTASRLQSAAAPGTVLVGNDTYLATVDAVRYLAVAPIVAKGKEEPIPAWQAIEALGRPGERRSRVRAPLIGRDDELALMRSALAMSAHRRRAQLLVVMGDAGLGKTRLAEEVVELAAAEHGAVICRGRCVPYGEANPWQPVAEAMRGVLGLSPDDALSHARTVIVAAVAPLFRAEPTSAEVERTTAGLLHLLGYDTPVARLEPQSQVLEAGRAVRTFLQAQANNAMTVLWLSDLHWADEVVLRLVDALCSRLSRLPFVAITTARYALNERWASQPGRHNTMVISLEPLDRESADRVITALVPGEVSRAWRDEIIDRAGGSPFVLQELVSLFGHSKPQAPGELELPSSVSGLVAARLDTLSDTERSVLEDASVMGRRGTVRGLATMVARTHADVDLVDTLRTLRDKDLMLVDRDEWSFRSELVRDIAYSRLTKTDRARRHAGIAEFLELHGEGPRIIDTVAFHYRRAAEAAHDLGRVPDLPVDIDERATTWLRRAAVGKAPDTAVRLISQAIALVPEAAVDRPLLLLERARLHTRAHQIALARRDIQDASTNADSRADVAAIINLRLGEIAHRSGDFVEAIARLEQATAQFRRIADTAGEAESLRLTGVTYLFTSRFDDAEHAIVAALAAFVDAHDAHGTAWSWQNLAWTSFARGRLKEAETRIAQAIRYFEEVKDEGGVAWCHGLLAHVRLHQGRLDEADTLSASALVDANERGERWGQGMILVLRASVHLWSGRTAAALRRAEDAIAAFRDLGDVFSDTQAYVVYARALALAGRVDDAYRTLDDAARKIGESPTTRPMALTISTAGAAVGADVGEPEVALRHAGGDMVDLLDPQIVGQGDRIVAIGLALAQLGRFADAQRVLTVAARDEPDAGRDPNALAAMAMVAVATGELALAADLIGAVESSPRSTYVDNVRAAIAEAFVQLRRGNQVAARDALVNARAMVMRTGDRVLGVVVSIAASTIDPALQTETEERCQTVGVGAAGWFALCRAMRGS